MIPDTPTPPPPNLYGCSSAQLEDALAAMDLPRYRAAQIFYWLYNRRATSFDVMSNLPLALRQELARRFTIAHPSMVTQSTSADGTIKYLFSLEDGKRIETVLIPSESEDAGQPKRLTVCVSTQVGCPLNCGFCATASMKLKRNLTPGEIIGQYAAVQNALDRRITNLVFMGMGEPMLNYDAVMAAVELLTHETTCGISSSHITLSTAGLVEGIRRMADERRKIKLAISLHATTDSLRTQLMPINRRHDLEELAEAAAYYYRHTRRRITYEYILFDGRNDSPDDARRLARFARRTPSKVNLIPFHPIDGAWPDGAPADLRPTPRARIDAFAAELRALGITVMLRSSSGRDIDAACGQLAVRHA